MKLYNYKDHDEYIREQTRANVIKLNKVWVNKKTIALIKSKVNYATNILCHGTRNAAEQKLFLEQYPDANIIGTEISHTASDFIMTVQHDFHEVNYEWLDKFDIVYSNSFDHSYDPNKSLSAWKDQLNQSGSLFIELMTGDDQKSKSTDPLEINEKEFKDLSTSLGLNVVDRSLTIGGDNRASVLYRLTK
jgi:hypothetical protein